MDQQEQECHVRSDEEQGNSRPDESFKEEDQDICQLGATCHHAYLLTSDELYWQFQAWKQTGVYLAQHPANFTRAFDKSTKHYLEGLVHDPTHQSIRNLSIIYSSEFRKMMIE